MLSAVVFAFMGIAMAGEQAASVDACAKKCINEWEACKNGPDPNQSYCAATISKCLGYNPFENGHGIEQVTACASMSSAAPTTTATAPAMDECAKKCTEAFDKCRKAPGANQSLCGSDYGNCLGYAPFANGGSLDSVTACSKGASASATGAAAATKTMGTVVNTVYDCPPGATSTTAIVLDQDECAKKCTDAFDKCRKAPGANQSLCGSDFGNCLGYAPFANGGSLESVTACSKGADQPEATNSMAPPVVTAAAGRMEPAMLLAAIGAAALL